MQPKTLSFSALPKAPVDQLTALLFQHGIQEVWPLKLNLLLKKTLSQTYK